MKEATSIINKVYLEGIVEQEPEIRYISYDWVEARLTLFTQEYIERNAGKVQEYKLWHKVIARGTVATEIERLVHQGTRLRLVGRIQYVQNRDRQGNAPLITNIECQEFQVLQKVNPIAKTDNEPSIVTPTELNWLQWREEHQDAPF